MTVVPYAGAPVSQLFRERWLSGLMVGGAAPTGLVEVRRGHLKRSFHPYTSFGFPVFGDFPGALATGFWYPDWFPTSDWETLDGVTSVKLDQSFDNNGIQTCTITMDNVALVAKTGHAGMIYHLMERGYYSPLRGYVPPKRPNPGVAKTPFYNFLPNAQIRVRQGYGADALVTTFLGLIDDIETDSSPSTLTITARDHGGVLVDEKFFGWAKDKNVQSPLTFAPRSITEDDKLVGGSAQASSHDGSNLPGNVLSADNKQGWRSEVAGTPADTQWIEIKVPAGKYSQLFLKFPFDNQEVFIGISPTVQGGSDDKPKPATVDGKPIHVAAGDWWDPNGNQVPGHFGGWSYFRTIPSTVAGPGKYLTMGAVFFVGDDTRIRLGFRKLGKVKGGFSAGIDRFQANRRRFTSAAIHGQYLSVDDVSDIVRCCLRWSGFKGWEVEDTGVGLKEPFVADPTMSFMDVINTVKDMVGFTFFIGEPRDDDDDQDLGYPIFRNNRVFENVTGPTEFIDDKLLLTDAKVKISNQDDHCIIRCRGIAKNDGRTINGDSVKRIMFAYIPAWGVNQGESQAGVLKPLNHTDPKFTSVDDCQFACYLIALQVALSKYTVILDLPANPGIGLDTLQSVIDRTQGLNSRCYISNRSQEMSFGSQGYWTMELGGAVVDTPDLDSVVADFKKAIKVLDRGGRNPWVRKRKGKAVAYGYENG